MQNYFFHQKEQEEIQQQQIYEDQILAENQD
jgi:hypothetical protein